MNAIQNYEIQLEDEERKVVEERAIMTTREAADFLRCSTVLIYQLVSARQLPAHHVGKKKLFLKEELLEYVRNN